MVANGLTDPPAVGLPLYADRQDALRLLTRRDSRLNSLPLTVCAGFDCRRLDPRATRQGYLRCLAMPPHIRPAAGCRVTSLYYRTQLLLLPNTVQNLVLIYQVTKLGFD